LRPPGLPSRRLCRRRATWKPTNRCREGDPMDVVVAAVILALAVLSFVWLRFVEKA
jgi:hypothetical protein